MTNDLKKTIDIVLTEAARELPLMTPGDNAAAAVFAAHAQMRIFDRWYRFTSFGIETRGQLAGVRVQAEWTRAPLPKGWGDGDGWELQTKVLVVGSKLEGR